MGTRQMGSLVSCCWEVVEWESVSPVELVDLRTVLERWAASGGRLVETPQRVASSLMWGREGRAEAGLKMKMRHRPVRWREEGTVGLVG